MGWETKDGFMKDAPPHDVRRPPEVPLGHRLHSAATAPSLTNDVYVDKQQLF